jgi:hypothetical protein
MTGPRPTPAPPPPTPTFLRPLLALLAGLGITALISAFGIVVATFAALRGVDPKQFTPPPAYLGTTLVLSVLGAFSGGYATARITAGRSFYTVLLLATVLLVSGVVPVVRGTGPAPGWPGWYPMAQALLVPLGALAGGLLERRRGRMGAAREV